MITMKQWMELVDYKLTEGGEFGWNCFGHYAQVQDSWNGDNDQGHSLSICWDSVTQVVYQVEVHDYKNERAYRFTNPDFRKVYEDEIKVRGGDVEYEYDMIDLELEEDWLEKATAIVAGKEYSPLISIPLELPDNELLQIFKMAHEADMTFNAFVIKLLTNAMEHRTAKDAA
jgi:hypothetical protein